MTDLSSWGFRRLLATTMLALVVLMSIGISTYFMGRARTLAQASLQARIGLMEDGLQTKGESLTRTLALAAKRAVVVMDFLFLSEVVETAVKHDEDVVYGILMGADKKPLIQIGVSDTQSTSEERIVNFAAAQGDVATQSLRVDGRDVLEVVAPITVGPRRWGTLRLGISLQGLAKAIEESKEAARVEMINGVLTAWIATALLTLLGFWAASAAARWLSRPVAELLQGVRRIREGDFTARVVARGAAELVRLGRAFNDMASAIRQRDEMLQRQIMRRELAVKQAEEANNIKGEILANVSHELRTPLNTILNVPASLLSDYREAALWRCETCGEDYEDDAPDSASERSERCPDCDREMGLTRQYVCEGSTQMHRHYLMVMAASAQHMLGLVTNLLESSRLEANQESLHISQINVWDLLTEAHGAMIEQARAKGVVLEAPVIESVAQIHADPSALRRVLLNLLENAVKFTEAGGRVELAACESPEQNGVVRFVVTDSGIGVAASDQELIFESFRQANSSHTRDHGGVGLGLSISRRLVERHGGRIWVESDSNRGSRFFFEIPHEPVAPQTPCEEQRSGVLGPS